MAGLDKHDLIVFVNGGSIFLLVAHPLCINYSFSG